MANDTAIQWTDATWNIARGCTKVDEDCKYCYMYRDSFDSSRYNPLDVVRTKTVFNFPLKYKETKSKVWSGRPLIFTSSLTDVFHPAIDSYRNEMWDIIRQCPHLIFQILTKRPERIEEHLPEDWGLGWENVWLGTSIGSDNSAARALELCRLGGGKHKLFLSLEPMHGPIWLNQIKDGYMWDVLTGLPYSEERERYVPEDRTYPVDWVIVGGESGNENGKYKYRPSELRWFVRIVRQCVESGVPVFVKQLGTHLAKELKMSDRHGGNINEFPVELQLRQFPKTL